MKVNLACVSGGKVSINSIDKDDLQNIENSKNSRAVKDESEKKACARRRIELLKDLKDSGLTLEEAKDLGLID